MSDFSFGWFVLACLIAALLMAGGLLMKSKGKWLVYWIGVVGFLFTVLFAINYYKNKDAQPTHEIVPQLQPYVSK